jgi:DNA-binding CsgD family transcriptional regulator
MQPRERLTAKEMPVAVLVGEGQTNRKIAKGIGTTEQVVKDYLQCLVRNDGFFRRANRCLVVPPVQAELPSMEHPKGSAGVQLPGI